MNRDCGGLVVATALDNDTPFYKGLIEMMVQVQCGLLTITTGFIYSDGWQYEFL